MMSLDLSFAPPPFRPTAGAGPVPPALITTQVRKNMLRTKSEPLRSTLDRIRLLLLPPQLKKHGRMGKAELLRLCPAAVLLDGEGKILDQSEPNGYVWPRAKTLEIGSTKVAIHYNIPAVTGITPPPVVFTGIPVCCSSIRLLFCSKSDLDVQWVLAPRLPSNQLTRRKEDDGGNPGDALPPPEPTTEQLQARPVLSDQLVIVPKHEWVGHPLVFRVRPKGCILWSETETTPVRVPQVTHRPQPRWDYVTAIQPPQLRVVSYNVLHDGFCSTHWAMTKLYPFATEHVLDINFRRGRIVQELMKYDADVVALQEVGKDVYDRYYNDVFKAQGFNSMLSVKNGNAKEGVAFAYRDARLEVMDKQRMSLGAVAMASEHPELAERIEKENPHVWHALKKVPSIAIMVVLKDKITGKHFVLVNTHFYFHAAAPHIRMLQYFMLSCAVDKFARKNPEFACEKNVIICGDFNASRQSGVYQLATHGSCEEGHVDWERGQEFYWGMSKLGEASDWDLIPGEYEADGAASEVEDEDAEGDADCEEDAEDYDAEDEPLQECDVNSAAADTTANNQKNEQDLNSPSPTSLKLPLQCPRRFSDTHAGVEPYVTNYTLCFKDGIDHIFYDSEGVTIHKVLPLPSEEEVAEEVALPSSAYSSDHLALVTDLEIK